MCPPDNQFLPLFFLTFYTSVIPLFPPPPPAEAPFVCGVVDVRPPSLKRVKSGPTCPRGCVSCDSPRRRIFVFFCCGATHLLGKYLADAPVRSSSLRPPRLLQMVPLPVVQQWRGEETGGYGQVFLWAVSNVFKGTWGPLISEPSFSLPPTV